MEDLLGMKLVIPLCARCKHYDKDGSCAAFPEGIPLKIMRNDHDHRTEYPGDNGVRFVQI